MNRNVWILVFALIPFSGYGEDEKAKLSEYFPKLIFSEDKRLHDFFAMWYSANLAIMKEPALPKRAKNSKNVIYRFTCLRTFDRPFSINVTKTKDGFVLTRKVLSGKGGYDPGILEETAKHSLKDAAVEELEKLLTELKFSKMKPTIIEDLKGWDGSHWMLEVVKEGRYKIVDRWSPDEGEPMRRIGEWFLDKAKWTPKEHY